MPTPGLPELLLILVVIVIIFGVGKLPQVGGAIGQSIKEFRKATKEGEADEAAKDTAAVSPPPPPAQPSGTETKA